MKKHKFSPLSKFEFSLSYFLILLKTLYANNSNSSTIFLYAANDPIIESSQNLKFAPYNVAYPFLDEQVKTVGFDISK